MSFVVCCVDLITEALPCAGVTWLVGSTDLSATRTARPGSRELPVDPDLRLPLGLPLLLVIYYVCMPSPLPRQVRWNGFAHYCSIVLSLSQITVIPQTSMLGSCLVRIQGKTFKITARTANQPSPVSDLEGSAYGFGGGVRNKGL
jgi:hypothetical protein